MQSIKILSSIIGRIFLSAVFIIAGLNKILNWSGTSEGYLEVLGKWHLATDNAFLERLLDFMAQRSGLFLGLATGLELIGGVLVLVGVFTRVGAVCLITFLIPVTIIYHAFWIMQSPEKDMQVVMFMKNLAILGGLMVVASFGSGFNWKRSED